MKLQLYPVAILLIILQILPPFEILAHTHFRSGSTPVSEITGLNNLYFGSFVQVTKPGYTTVVNDTPKVILPITLVSFNAAIQNNIAVLNWRMVSELNSGDFFIEKSSDGLNFTAIGTISASIGHAGFTEYNFIDLHPYFGNNYYRVKLVEVLEEERCLGVRKVNFAYSTIVYLYPNPVSGSNINLQTAAAIDGKITFIISDMSGRIMKTGKVANYPHQMDVSCLNTGFYILKLSNGTNIKFQKQ